MRIITVAIFLIIFLFNVSCSGMQSSSENSGDQELFEYITFLYTQWRLGTINFFLDHTEDPKSQKLERFKNNYLAAALINRHYFRRSVQDAALRAYRMTPVCPLAFHNIINDRVDDFDEQFYRHVNIRESWRNEFRQIEDSIVQFYTQ